MLGVFLSALGWVVGITVGVMALGWFIGVAEGFPRWARRLLMALLAASIFLGPMTWQVIQHHRHPEKPVKCYPCPAYPEPGDGASGLGP